MRAEAEWAQTPKRVGTNNTSRIDTRVSRDKRVGKDTSWAQRHKSGHKDIECAQRHRVGTKSQRVQKDRVVTNAASSHTHECAQAE